MNAATAFALGWRWAGRVPEWLRRGLSVCAADLTWLRRGDGVRRLEKNLARVVPEASPKQLRALSRRGMRSYLRYFEEIFALPSCTDAQVDARVRAVGVEQIQEALAAGRSVALATGHVGNWDLAGAWSKRHLGRVTTVAERLEPEELFEQFTRFRSGLGIEAIPLSESGADVFRQLVRVARAQPTLIPLLADRDLTAKGIEVDLFGQRARVAAGPAALAIAADCMLVPFGVHYERLSGTRRRQGGTPWGIVITFGDPLPVPDGLRRGEVVPLLTQAWVSALGVMVREHPEDWHMLQRVFVDDLDPARDAAVRATDGAAS